MNKLNSLSFNVKITLLKYFIFILPAAFITALTNYVDGFGNTYRSTISSNNSVTLAL